MSCFFVQAFFFQDFPVHHLLVHNCSLNTINPRFKTSEMWDTHTASFPRLVYSTTASCQKTGQVFTTTFYLLATPLITFYIIPSSHPLFPLTDQLKGQREKDRVEMELFVLNLSVITSSVKQLTMEVSKGLRYT